MKICGVCKVEKSVTEFSTARGKPTWLCRPCEKESKRRYYELNKEKIKQKSVEWRKANPGRYTEYMKEYYNANKEKINHRASEWQEDNEERYRQRLKDYYAANKEKLKAKQQRWRETNREAHRAYSSQWAKEHPDKMRAHGAKRKAAKLQAIPPWADLDAVTAIYETARRMTEQTGVQHHVDHIYPLQNELVCGLHCEANLQILTAEENLRKGNRMPGTPPLMKRPILIGVNRDAVMYRGRNYPMTMAWMSYEKKKSSGG